MCDRPARAFCKSIINHGSFYACERCSIKGITVQNRRVYPSVDPQLRTDESFREFKNLHHHTVHSPLCDLSPKINMVKDFPMEILHLVFLGIMKKMITEC